MNELLLNIFLEAAHKASIIPLAAEATIYAMKSFGNHDMLLPVLLAILGGLSGHVFNFFAGKLLLRLPSFSKTPVFFSKASALFNRYGFVVLFFAYAPLCNLLVVIAGLSGCKWYKAFACIGAGLVFHYIQL